LCLIASLLCCFNGWFFPPPSSFVEGSLELGEVSFPTTIREVGYFFVFFFGFVLSFLLFYFFAQ
jgi:hypothetical protein